MNDKTYSHGQTINLGDIINLPGGRQAQVTGYSPKSDKISVVPVDILPAADVSYDKARGLFVLSDDEKAAKAAAAAEAVSLREASENANISME